MNNGELVDVVKTSETDEHEVGLLMAGVKGKDGAK
jgi:simple sugar transport system ATP-binding protein